MMTSSNLTSKPLNIVLYNRLVATFGKVLIKNPGSAAITGKAYDSVKGRVVDTKVQSGEQYAVCCPMCNDTRFRLFISHQYGLATSKNTYNEHKAYCFNFGCPLNSKEPEAYVKLARMLTGSKLYDLSKARIAAGRVSRSSVPLTWPGQVVRVDRLDKSHPCRKYLELDRLYDIEVLAKSYNVHFCTESEFKVCEGKIIIPVYSDKKMVGWQARCCFDVEDWSTVYTPKYYTAPSMPKSQYLYNLDVASKCGVGVCVEGVTDVWRVGSPAICGWGASLSAMQVQLIVRYFRHKPFVWLLDGDVWAKDSKIDPKTVQRILQIAAEFKASLKSGFCLVKLPSDKDPGSFTSRAYLRGYISHHAAEQGVEISWS